MKPTWLIGKALRICGVPCAEEIAMMLAKKEAEPIGKYLSLTYKSPTDTTAIETTEHYTEFYEFPLEVESKLRGLSSVGKPTPFSKSIDIDTTLYGKNIKAKVGDFVRIRYIFPEVWSDWDNSPGGSGKDVQGYYTIYVYFKAASIAENERTQAYMYYKSNTGACSCSNDALKIFATQYYPLLENHTFMLIKDDEDNTIGCELSGTLLAEIDTIEINITSYCSTEKTPEGYRNATATVKYDSYEDFTITVNE